MKQDFSPSQKAKVQFVIGLLAAGVVALVVLLGILFWQNFQGRTPQENPTIPTTASIPFFFVPTPDCGTPTLVIDSTMFQIQPIQTAPDGALTIPTDGFGIAYWVNETNSNYMFGLSPTQENLSLISSLPPESTATVTWSNCNATSYTLLVLEQSPVGISTLLDQSTEGITIFLLSDPFMANYILRGELTGEQISIFNTPSGMEIQAEISLLETTVSAEGTNIQIGVSIQNYGNTSFTLSVNDVSLVMPDGAPLTMLNSEPLLPKDIGAGAIETIYFTFPRPPSQTTLLTILGIEYDIEGY